MRQQCRAKLLRGVREAGNRPSGRTDIEGNQTAVTQCITPILLSTHRDDLGQMQEEGIPAAPLLPL